jgi:anaerobic magnesium-protoporphyrin IX monomethyl ester cyclase
VKAQLGEKTHWQDSDDLAMMFRGAYDSDFYRSVRDLMHAQITIQQSKGTETPEHYAQAVSALDARWNALLATEYQHRTEHAGAAPAITSSHSRQLRHVATAQNR